jgi:hypothetical protein
MGMNDFAPFLKKNGCFVVKNITLDRQKTIKIFNYPIPFNQTRDILQIPGVSESDIRASLLKGELRHKILAQDIIIECSDIDLLQFNDDQKLFLQNAGIIRGLEVSGGTVDIPFLFRQNIDLGGDVDGVNRIFTTPDKFINGTYQSNTFKIQVFHNGRALLETEDYIVSESGGVGTGYDTIIFVSFVPLSNSKIFANYMIINP